MSNERKIECKIKAGDKPLSAWDRRLLSEEYRVLFVAYGLEYVIITRSDYD